MGVQNGDNKDNGFDTKTQRDTDKKNRKRARGHAPQGLPRDWPNWPKRDFLFFVSLLSFDSVVGCCALSFLMLPFFFCSYRGFFIVHITYLHSFIHPFIC